MPNPPLTEEEMTQIQNQLNELNQEHRDLDLVIVRLSESQPVDELLVRRMKKRKLTLKDKASALERLLVPDIPA